jgi:NAD(P)H-hydrate epimerase
VIDADALNIVARNVTRRRDLGANVVITPHYGEMARLTGESAESIAQSPWDVARAAAAEWDQVVVLKGPFTVVAPPSGGAAILTRANPALSTGGTGDVLAGLIAGLMAQGLAPRVAARVAVYVHGAAAHHVLTRGERDLLLASDLLVPVARELARLRIERGDGIVTPSLIWTEPIQSSIDAGQAGSD